DGGIATHTINSFNDYKYIEKDEDNFLKSGSEWYGDLFDLLTTRNYNLSFSNISSSPVHVTVNLVAKHTSPSSFNVTESNSGAAVVVPINAISAGSTGKFASETRDTLTFVPTSNNVSLSVTYN